MARGYADSGMDIGINVRLPSNHDYIFNLIIIIRLEHSTKSTISSVSKSTRKIYPPISNPFCFHSQIQIKSDIFPFYSVSMAQLSNRDIHHMPSPAQSPQQPLKTQKP